MDTRVILKCRGNQTRKYILQYGIAILNYSTTSSLEDIGESIPLRNSLQQRIFVYICRFGYMTYQAVGAFIPYPSIM